MTTIQTPTYYSATKQHNLSVPTLEQDVDAEGFVKHCFAVV